MVDNYNKLRKVRKILFQVYEGTFLSNFLILATEKKGRYLPIKHNKLKVGDIDLIKDTYIKSYNYLLGRIVRSFINSKNEATHVEVLKGSTKEISKRHVSFLIPLITGAAQINDSEIADSTNLSNS